MRLDQWLVKNRIAPSRTKAQELIRTGAVEVFRHQEWQVVQQPSFGCSPSEQVRLVSPELLKYVSRGGLKMEGAIRRLGLEARGLDVLDIGISTGGFSDCLLQRGCASVVGVDVGRDQIHPRVAEDARVRVFEGLHIKEAWDNREFGNLAQLGFDLIVVDVSFISLTHVIPLLLALLRPNGRVLALVKPQFEVGKTNLSKAGLVKDIGLYQDVQVKIQACASESSLKVLDYFPSEVAGADGNQEFLIFLARST
ncbi:MAG: TlyA family RNA methyltransferase [Bdellovibrionaceae bacterium]|nr:TlyA family RNA methyltransferase [Bdellovibrionales bacterium]MCB9086197.1 TlyA family RNA methyltransferase [Pseudobdellovibrionaceae bacterium]